jgi:hypothetical protein
MKEHPATESVIESYLHAKNLGESHPNNLCAPEVIAAMLRALFVLVLTLCWSRGSCS